MSLSGIEKAPKEEDLNWLTLSKFEAETTLSEKVNRVANYLVFGAGVYSSLTFTIGGSELGYISYISLGLITRKIVSTTIGYLVYPAASILGATPDSIKIGKQNIQLLEKDNFIVKKVSLHKSGIKYDATIVTHPHTIQNGKWTINALGNGMSMEGSLIYFAKENFVNKSNSLFVNGPSVCESKGWPTRYQMGAGFEAGISFLERGVKATHIIMHGLSLGGGMMGEAILTHDFTEGMKKNIRYLSITDRSFSRLSAIAGALVSRFVEPLFSVTGTELDGIGAARKLSELGIEQIIIQHISEGSTSDDYVIPDSVSTAHELHKDPTLKGKIFLESKFITHNGSLPKDIEVMLKQKIENFLNS